LSQEKRAIAFSLADLIVRAILPKKRGYIDSSTLGISEDDSIEVIKNFRRHYGSCAGSKESFRRCANEHHHCWYKGVG